MTEEASITKTAHQTTPRPLALTKRGKIIAVIGGIPSGPMGLIASPLALCIINRLSRNDKRNVNRFPIWSLTGIPSFFVLWVIQVSAILVFGAVSCGDQAGCMEDGPGWDISPRNNP